MAVASSLLATSCITVDKTLGAENIPDDYKLKLNTATLHLPLQTKIMDSLDSNNPSYGYLGALRSSEFGLSTFSFAANYRPFFKLEHLGKDRVVKKAWITMRRASLSILSEDQEGLPQTFHVYRMTRVIDSACRYNNTFKESDYIPTPIDSGGVIYTGKDTLVINLKKSFAKELLTATKEEIEDVEKFKKRFKALYYTCDVPQEGTPGGRLNKFDLSANTSNPAFINIQINFKPTWGDQPRKDTVITLYVNSGLVQNYSTYESKSLEKAEPQKYITIEGVGGIKPYLDPAVLKDTLDNWVARMGYKPERVLIGRATYVLPFEFDEARLSAINKLYASSLYPNNRTKDTTLFCYTPLEDVYSSNNLVGSINRSLNSYSGDISSHIQKIVNKSKSEILTNSRLYSMWFAPLITSSGAVSYYSTTTTTVYSLDKETYPITTINGPLHKDYPRLELVYTILPE